MNERMSPCSTGLRPLRGRCPASSHSNSQSCKAGQQVSLTTYCPWATGFQYYCGSGGLIWSLKGLISGLRHDYGSERLNLGLQGLISSLEGLICNLRGLILDPRNLILSPRGLTWGHDAH